jgi:hypothetical protein
MEPCREQMVQGCMIKILAAEFTTGSCEQRLEGMEERKRVLREE